MLLSSDTFLDHALPLMVPHGDSQEAITTVYGWNLPPKFDLRHKQRTSVSPNTRYLLSSLGWQWQSVLAEDAVVVHETQNESAAQADSLPCIFSGHITEPGQRDRIRFPVEPSVRYRAVVHSRSFGFPLDSVLRVTRVADGSEVVRNDDTARDQYDAEVTWTSKASDQMELEISDLVDGYGPRHAYSVEISPVQPTAE